MICPYCGKGLKHEALYCPFCGNILDHDHDCVEEYSDKSVSHTDDDPFDEYYKMQEKKNEEVEQKEIKKQKKIAVGIAIIVAIIFITFYFIKTSSGKSPLEAILDILSEI